MGFWKRRKAVERQDHTAPDPAYVEEFYDTWRRNRSDEPMPNTWIPRY